jgi:hypothetical protein
MGVEKIAKNKVEFGRLYSLDELTDLGLTTAKADKDGYPAFENDSTVYYFAERDGKYRASYGLGKVSTSIFNSNLEDD